MGQIETLDMDSGLNGFDLKKLIRIMGEISDIYERTGLISVDPDLGVMLTNTEFKQTFSDWTEIDFDSERAEIIKMVENTKFYALSHKDIADDEDDNHEGPENINLPALQLNNEKIRLLTQVIDFFRLKNNLPEGLDSQLLQLTEEIKGGRK